jgi:hypothetical protein
MVVLLPREREKAERSSCLVTLGCAAGRAVGLLGCTAGRLGWTEGRVAGLLGWTAGRLGCTDGRVAGRVAGLPGCTAGRVTPPVPTPGRVDGLAILLSRLEGNRLVSRRAGVPPVAGRRASSLFPVVFQVLPWRVRHSPDPGSSLWMLPSRPT